MTLLLLLLTTACSVCAGMAVACRRVRPAGRWFGALLASASALLAALGAGWLAAGVVLAGGAGAGVVAKWAPLRVADKLAEGSGYFTQERFLAGAAGIVIGAILIATLPGSALAGKGMVVLSGSALVFTFGVVGLLVRRGLEALVLSAAVTSVGALIALAAFGAWHGNRDGEVLGLVAVVVALAQAGAALACAAALARRGEPADVAQWHSLRSDVPLANEDPDSGGPRGG